jgi:hypothetical protein
MFVYGPGSGNQILRAPMAKKGKQKTEKLRNLWRSMRNQETARPNTKIEYEVNPEGVRELNGQQDGRVFFSGGVGKWEGVVV